MSALAEGQIGAFVTSEATLRYLNHFKYGDRLRSSSFPRPRYPLPWPPGQIFPSCARSISPWSPRPPGSSGKMTSSAGSGRLPVRETDFLSSKKYAFAGQVPHMSLRAGRNLYYHNSHAWHSSSNVQIDSRRETLPSVDHRRSAGYSQTLAQGGHRQDQGHDAVSRGKVGQPPARLVSRRADSGGR